MVYVPLTAKVILRQELSLNFIRNPGYIGLSNLSVVKNSLISISVMSNIHIKSKDIYTLIESSNRSPTWVTQ